MARKKIFTPFKIADAGLLASTLEYREDKEDGEYRGFKPEDRVFLTLDADQRPCRTEALKALQAPDDQLYVNGHCTRGAETLATREDGTGATVNADAVVSQLEANGLPEATQAKIKLWACLSATPGDYGKEPFVFHFARSLHAARYRNARLFAYTHSLRQQMEATKDPREKGGWHKYGVLESVQDSDSAVLRRFLFMVQTNQFGKGKNLAAGLLRALAAKAPGFNAQQKVESYSEVELQQLAAAAAGANLMKAIRDVLLAEAEGLPGGAGVRTGERAHTYRREVLISAAPMWK